MTTKRNLRTPAKWVGKYVRHFGNWRDYQFLSTTDDNATDDYFVCEWSGTLNRACDQAYYGDTFETLEDAHAAGYDECYYYCSAGLYDMYQQWMAKQKEAVVTAPVVEEPVQIVTPLPGGGVSINMDAMFAHLDAEVAAGVDLSPEVMLGDWVTLPNNSQDTVWMHGHVEVINKKGAALIGYGSRTCIPHHRMYSGYTEPGYLESANIGEVWRWHRVRKEETFMVDGVECKATSYESEWVQVR